MNKDIPLELNATFNKGVHIIILWGSCHLQVYPISTSLLCTDPVYKTFTMSIMNLKGSHSQLTGHGDMPLN